MAKAKEKAKTYEYSMEEVCMSILGVNRFYATILSKLVKIEIKSGTAAVGFNKFGKICLFYNPDFILTLPLAQAQGCVVHEVLHVFFRHLTRFKINEENRHLAKLYNLGMDMAINQYLPDLPEGVIYPETFGLEKEKSADWYIEELKKLAEQQNKCPQCGTPMQGQGEGQDQQGDGQDQQQQGNDVCPNCGHQHPSNGQTLDSHDLWDKVIDDNGQVHDAKEYDIDAEYEVTSTVMKAIKECKEYGSLPDFVEKEIENLKTIKRHNWKKELKVFVNTVLTSKKRLSQKRVNRRLHDAEYILPGKKKSRNPKLLLVRDTSGSMYDDATQEELLNEMIQISKSASVLVCDCDTQVHQTYTVRKASDFKNYKGGGGTSFEPAFEEAKKLQVDGIVYLTDTDGSFPDKKDIGKFASQTIWVTFNDSRDIKNRIPFGKHVNIDTSKK